MHKAKLPHIAKDLTDDNIGVSHTVLMKSSLTQMPSKKGRHTSLSVKCFCLSFSSPAPTSPSNKEGEERRKNRKSNGYTVTNNLHKELPRYNGRERHPLISLKVIARSHFLAKGMLKMNLMATLTVLLCFLPCTSINTLAVSMHTWITTNINSKWWWCACFNYAHTKNRTQLTSIFLPSLHW